MKQHFSKILTIAALVSTPLANAHLFIPRSQSVNAARELAGWEHAVNKSDMDDIYGTFAVTIEGVSSFNSAAIASCLLGDDVCCDDCPTLVIQGSGVAERRANAWLADYFGLPTDFQSIVQFNPTISNLVVDLNTYVGLDNILQGLYVRVHAPIQRTVWKLNMEESNVSGHATYPSGYMSPASAGLPSSPAFQSFTAATSGEVEVTAVGAPADYTFAFNRAGGSVGFDVTQESMYRPLAVNLFPGNDCDDCQSHKKAGLADLRAMIGWNFLRSEDYHLGLGLIVAAPTGNVPSPEYIFSPIVGNGHHTEIGGQLTTHYTFWRNEADTRSFGLYLDLNVTHLFASCQDRVMDLCGKENSRFMLAQKLVADSTITGSYSFAGEFTQVANLTTRSFEVSVPWQVDLAILANYTSGAFSLGLGYEFFGQACEKYGCSSDCALSLDGAHWALKGDAFVYTGTGGAGSPVTRAVGATEKCATIHNGTNGSVVAGTVAVPNNAKVDNPVLLNSSYTSNPPVFITEADLDVNGSKTKARSNKVFAHMTYTWEEWKHSENWLPYVSIGTEVEWGNGSDCNSCDNACSTISTSSNTAATCAPAATAACGTSCATECDSCENCALSQWGIWFKGGLSFN